MPVTVVATLNPTTRSDLTLTAKAYTGTGAAVTTAMTESPASSARYVATFSGLTVSAAYQWIAVDGTGKAYWQDAFRTDAAGGDASGTANVTQWGNVAVTGMPMPTYLQPAGFLGTTFAGSVGDATADQVGAVAGNAASIAANVAVLNQTIMGGVGLTPTERNLLAAVIESHLLNDGDGQMLVNAIVGAIGNSNVDQTAFVAAMIAGLEGTGRMLPAVMAKAELIGTDAGDSPHVMGLAGGGGGNGDVLVTHNYGGTDNLRVLESDGTPADNVRIRAYVTADLSAGLIDPTPPETTTGSDGRWIAGLYLDAGAYTLNHYNPQTKRTTARLITVI